MKVCVFINLTLRGIKQGNEDKLEVPVSLQKWNGQLHAELSGILLLLMVQPENFMESDVETLLKTVNGTSIQTLAEYFPCTS